MGRTGTNHHAVLRGTAERFQEKDRLVTLPLAASHAIGFQIAASSLGGAGIPALAGILAKRFGLEIIGPYLVAVAGALLVLHELALRLAPPIKDGGTLESAQTAAGSSPRS